MGKPADSPAVDDTMMRAATDESRALKEVDLKHTQHEKLRDGMGWDSSEAIIASQGAKCSAVLSREVQRRNWTSFTYDHQKLRYVTSSSDQKRI